MYIVYNQIKIHVILLEYSTGQQIKKQSFRKQTTKKKGHVFTTSMRPYNVYVYMKCTC